MKRFVISTLLFIVVVFSWSGLSAQPKYVFFFIGDGMGLGITHAAELYKAAEKGETGYKSEPLLFSKFPVIGITNTSSYNSFITDSAAAGTALATGEKTTQGTIGLSHDHQRELKSIAKKFKEQGRGVAIVSTVSIDHATPAAYYAHNTSRKNYFEIAIQGAKSNFDILGGSGFVEGEDDKGNSVYEPYRKAGYTHIKGKEELYRANGESGKILITERDGVSHDALSLATDRTSNDLTLSDLVSTSIEHMYRKYADKGFMVMAEAGQIDWCNHSNDVNGSIHEVLDLEKAVMLAYEFYKKHPEETLIIVTADHETGGYGNGRSDRGYNMDLKPILKKVESHAHYSERVEDYLEDKANFNRVPLPNGFQFSKTDVKELKKVYNDIIKNKVDADYVDVVYSYISKAVGAGWTTDGHTGTPVMVYTIGKGMENFGGYYDNTELPRKIERLTL